MFNKIKKFSQFLVLAGLVSNATFMNVAAMGTQPANLSSSYDSDDDEVLVGPSIASSSSSGTVSAQSSSSASSGSSATSSSLSSSGSSSSSSSSASSNSSLSPYEEAILKRYNLTLESAWRFDKFLKDMNEILKRSDAINEKKKQASSIIAEIRRLDNEMIAELKPSVPLNSWLRDRNKSTIKSTMSSERAFKALCACDSGVVNVYRLSDINRKAGREYDNPYKDTFTVDKEKALIRRFFELLKQAGLSVSTVNVVDVFFRPDHSYGGIDFCAIYRYSEYSLKDALAILGISLSSSASSSLSSSSSSSIR